MPSATGCCACRPDRARSTLLCHPACVTIYPKAAFYPRVEPPGSSGYLRDLLVFAGDAAHVWVAGAIRGGSRFPFLVRRWPLAAGCPFPNLSCPGRAWTRCWPAHSRTTGKVILPMRISGTVKFFNGAKGFGFITPEDGGKDVFVHATALERAGLRTLNEGDRVTFCSGGRQERSRQAGRTDRESLAETPQRAEMRRRASPGGVLLAHRPSGSRLRTAVGLAHG